ncbi:MAG: hypothetical protein WCS37_10100 [Chloroflexota bacterium]
MESDEPSKPEGVTPEGEIQAVSEAERLVEQGYRTLVGVAGVHAETEAFELCQTAIEIFRSALEAAGDDLGQRAMVKQGLAAAYSQLGHQQRYIGNHVAAITALTEALRFNPTLSEDYYYRAQSQLKAGDEQAARKDFTEYLRRGEDDYLRNQAKEQIATLALKAEDGTIRAKHWQDEGIRLNTEASSAMLPRGEALPEPARAAALYNKAQEALGKARELNPKDPLTKYALLAALSQQAECYLAMNEYDLAIDNYSRAYAVQPLLQHLFSRGEAYRAAGHLEQARADFEQYLMEGNDSALKLQAKTYLEEKPKQPALEVL